MLSLTTDAGVPLLSSMGLHLDVAGAESNCAIALARLGKRASWHSKVASGTLGERVISGIRAHGVDVGLGDVEEVGTHAVLALGA